METAVKVGLDCFFGNGYFDQQTGQFLAATTRQDAVGLLAATVLANPAGMLMGPLLVWNGRRRKKGGRIPPSMWLLFGVILAVGLAGCDQDDAATPTMPSLPEDGGTATVPGPDSNSAPATGTPAPGGGVTITATPCPTPGNPTDSNPTVAPPPAVTPIPTTGPMPSPTPNPTAIIVFGGSDGIDLDNPGPDPSTQIPVWNDIPGVIVIPYDGAAGGRKTGQASQVSISAYEDYDLILIGFSAGADAALIFADSYRAHQVKNDTPGRITDIAILAGTMSDETGKLQTEGFRILTDLLLWETDIYILDDSAAFGAEAATYIPPQDPNPDDEVDVGMFHFEPRTWQEHWQGGERGTGTNNSEAFRTEVFDWFRNN